MARDFAVLTPLRTMGRSQCTSRRVCKIWLKNSICPRNWSLATLTRRVQLFVSMKRWDFCPERLRCHLIFLLDSIQSNSIVSFCRGHFFFLRRQKLQLFDFLSSSTSSSSFVDFSSTFSIHRRLVGEQGNREECWRLPTCVLIIEDAPREKEEKLFILRAWLLSKKRRIFVLFSFGSVDRSCEHQQHQNTASHRAKNLQRRKYKLS